jgi:hypothetical protein
MTVIAFDHVAIPTAKPDEMYPHLHARPKIAPGGYPP